MLNQALIDGTPSIHFDPLSDCLLLTTHWLDEEDIEIILQRLNDELDSFPFG